MGKFLTVVYITGLLILFISVGALSSVAQETPAPTPQGIYGVLLDNNALIYCYIVSEPMPDVFLTATAINNATPTPTRTTVPIASPTDYPIPPTPTQEFAVTVLPAPNVMTTTNALNLRECPSLNCRVLTVIPFNALVTVNNDRQLVGGIWWRSVVYNAVGGWVSEAYLR